MLVLTMDGWSWRICTLTPAVTRGLLSSQASPAKPMSVLLA